MVKREPVDSLTSSSCSDSDSDDDGAQRPYKRVRPSESSLPLGFLDPLRPEDFDGEPVQVSQVVTSLGSKDATIKSLVPKDATSFSVSTENIKHENEELKERVKKMEEELQYERDRVRSISCQDATVKSLVAKGGTTFCLSTEKLKYENKELRERIKKMEVELWIERDRLKYLRTLDVACKSLVAKNAITFRVSTEKMKHENKELKERIKKMEVELQYERDRIKSLSSQLEDAERKLVNANIKHEALIAIVHEERSWQDNKEEIKDFFP